MKFSQHVFGRLIIYSSIFFAAIKPLVAAHPWEPVLSKDLDDSSRWISLMNQLEKYEKFYSLALVAQRSLMLFNDIQSKEAALRKLVKVADSAYFLPLADSFYFADFEPNAGDDFYSDFYFYKFIAEVSRPQNRWTDLYLQQVKKQKSTRYTFYQAIVAYQKNKLNEAEGLFKKVLSENQSKLRGAQIRAARALGRIYFDRGEYLKSLDIQQNFLLHLNPIRAEDWIDAAWSLYHLERYQEALGYLFNLEGIDSRRGVYLEKYIIRGLIYRELCLHEQIEKLSTQFALDFGAVIDAIKLGTSIFDLPEIEQVISPETRRLHELLNLRSELDAEAASLGYLDTQGQELFRRIYKNESTVLSRLIKSAREDAAEPAAEQLVNLAEKIKFLGFNVSLHQYAPEAVFGLDANRIPEVPSAEKELNLFWTQSGTFWRDERAKYIGTVKNKCKE